MRLYKSSGIIDRTGAQTMLYLTCTTISSVDIAQYGVSLAKDWVSVECGTNVKCDHIWEKFAFICCRSRVNVTCVAFLREKKLCNRSSPSIYGSILTYLHINMKYGNILEHLHSSILFTVKV